MVALPEPEHPPVPRKNMVWIAAGAFIAGTPPDSLPRIADEEMPGVQVVLHGYYIDQFPFPNEPGAIQATNVTREEASAKCAAIDKRLCSELEWERACKGPNSTIYEYGAAYRAQTCALGRAGHLTPTGTSVGCRSGYDVSDLHGGAFEWTASDWNRGGPSELAVVRGGSGEPGEVIGRCANARARRPDRRFPDVGFRCCAGDPNDVEVSLEVVRSPESIKVLARNPEISHAIEQHLPESLTKKIPESSGAKFHVDRLWRWHPIGNEELVLGAGCAHPGPHAVCGVVIVRFKNDTVQPLAFASSGWWLPNIQLDDDRRVLWVYGGDGLGKYRRRVAYLWGRIGVAEPELGGVKLKRD
jgi:Sulfatase-modifying factor enzyme 1